MAFKDHWNLPKNANSFFSPKQEMLLKQKYGIWYILHVVFSVIIVVAPCVGFMIMIPEQALNPKTGIGNILGAVGGIFGIVGAFSIGFGLVNVFFALIKQYLGHWVTLASVGIGVILELIGYGILLLVR